MTENDGVLVSRKWLERVNVKLFGNKDVDKEGEAAGGLFYDIRPARLQSAWSQNAAGVWVATACFVVNNVADTSFIFDISAPTAAANPGGTVGTTAFFVVWRGRWELLASAGASPTYGTVTVMGVYGVNYLYFSNTKTGNSSDVLTSVSGGNNYISFSKVSGTFARATAKTVVTDV